MDKFDLGRLTDFDFERVCRDLFSELLGVRLEVFSPGADGGIDLRHMSPGAERSIVIQCKHWARSGRSALIRHLREVEKAKVDALRPSRYILATSVEMTVGGKSAIRELFSPYIESTGDIYGVDEIVAELGARPELVRRHLRLWLSSSAVLETLLNRNIIARSAALVEDLDETLKLYAPNESFDSALELLDDKHVCVIAGIPGIGKTTLARVLSANLLADGYDLIEISEDIEELFRVWNDNEKQVFYYDDFLGQTTLDDKLHKNEDSRLLSAIKKVTKSPNKRLLLTTREYILAQARQRYEKLASQDFAPMTYVVDLGRYTPIVRAEMLYNHLAFSDLPREDVSKFGDPYVYRPIIEHPNFNPRIIALSLQLSTSATEGEGVSAPKRVMNNLRNPAHIWDHIVEYELSEEGLALLAVLFTHGTGVSIADLEQSWESYLRAQGRSTSSREFRRNVSSLEETMIRTSKVSNVIVVGFHNPSVIDYLRSYIANQRDLFPNVLSSATSVHQFRNSYAIANGRDGEGLLRQLEEHAKTIGDALLRVSRTELQSLDSLDAARNISTIIELATQLNRRDLFDYAAELLDGEWADHFTSTDEMTDIVRALDSSAFDRAQQMKQGAAAEVARWVLGDVSGWSLKRSAIDTLNDLGELAPAGEIESLEDDLRREAEETLAAWTDPDEGWGGSMSELSDIVQFASEYHDPEYHFPGYSNAAHVVDGWENGDREGGYRRSATSASTSASDSRMIGEMMGLLSD